MPRLDITREEYFAHPAVSQSQLKLAKSSPALYHKIHIARTLTPPPPSDAQRMGIATEDALREGAVQLDGSLVIIPDEVLNDAGHRRGAAYKEFAAGHEGKTLLTRAEYDDKFAGIESMLDSAINHDQAAKLLWSANSIWSSRWTWLHDLSRSVGAMDAKAELDIYNPQFQVVVDVKTARDTNPEWFAKEAINRGYHIQAAMYLNALIANGIASNVWTFAWIVLRNQEPYDCEVFVPDEEFMKLGQLDLDDCWENYLRCKEHGFKSRTHGEFVSISLPPWAGDRKSRTGSCIGTGIKDSGKYTGTVERERMWPDE